MERRNAFRPDASLRSSTAVSAGALSGRAIPLLLGYGLGGFQMRETRVQQAVEIEGQTAGLPGNVDPPLPRRSRRYERAAVRQARVALDHRLQIRRQRSIGADLDNGSRSRN